MSSLRLLHFHVFVIQPEFVLRSHKAKLGSFHSLVTFLSLFPLGHRSKFQQPPALISNACMGRMRGLGQTTYVFVRLEDLLDAFHRAAQTKADREEPVLSPPLSEK